MIEALLKGGEQAGIILGHLLRIATLVLGGLGTVYIPHKQLKLKMSERVCHITALVSMLIYSGCVTWVYFKGPISKMIWETFIFWVIANVGYVIFGWNFYSRMDSFLDKKLGED